MFAGRGRERRRSEPFVCVLCGRVLGETLNAPAVHREVLCLPRPLLW